MRITSVQVFPLKNNDGKLIAYARVVMDDSLMLSSLKVYYGGGRINPFVSYPNEGGSSGQYDFTFYPVEKKLRDEINEAVLAEYYKKISEDQNED